MNPICKACGNEFPPRRGRAAANIYCSPKCSQSRHGKRLTHAELLVRASRIQRPDRSSAFDPGLVEFLIEMIGLCLEHACATCECWREMALQWFANRECRGAGLRVECVGGA